MSIETSPSSTSGPVPTRSAGAVSRSGHGAASSAAPAGLFSCVLTGLDETLTSAVPLLSKDAVDLAALPGKGTALATDQATGLDAAAQALLAQFLGMGISQATPAQSDPSAVAVSGAGLTGAKLRPDSTLASQATEPPSGLLTSTLPAGVQDSVASVALPAVALPAVANPDRLQAFKPPQIAATAGVATGTAAPLHVLRAADAAVLAATQADAFASSPGSSPRAGQSAVRLAFANAQGLVKWQQTQVEQATVQATASGTSARDVFPDLALRPSTSSIESASLPGLVTAVGGSDAVLAGRRERSNPGPGAARFEPMKFSGAAVPVFDANPAAAPTTAAAPLAASVAEQVKYWMTNDIRNAELKLDGLGTEPVQVSITMSGNEAQVVFRSDQPQTRELLGNAMGQLEQLLRGEGLALAGAWVGTSGQQAGSGGNAQQGQTGSTPQPQASGHEGVSSVGAVATGRRVVPAERVLDLFA